MRSTLAFGPQITMHTLASFPTPLVPSRMALYPYPLISYGPKGACIGCLNRSSHMPRQPRRYSCRYGYSIRVRGAMHHEDLILYALCSITSPAPLTDSIHSIRISRGFRLILPFSGVSACVLPCRCRDPTNSDYEHCKPWV
jgi:hypothetical protein